MEGIGEPLWKGNARNVMPKSMEMLERRLHVNCFLMANVGNIFQKVQLAICVNFCFVLLGKALSLLKKSHI